MSAGAPCAYGHPYERYPDGKCAPCVRARVKAWKDRKRGGPPRIPDPVHFPCGHPREGNRRRGRRDCATCHAVSQRERYHSDVHAHRAKARAYQKANRDAANKRLKAWQRRNPGYRYTRQYDADPDTRAWVALIKLDPCAYCGERAEAVDHIRPVSRGGENHWTNFAPACRACNSSKHARDLLPWLLDRMHTTRERITA